MILHTEHSTGSGGQAGFDMLSPGSISETTAAMDSAPLNSATSCISSQNNTGFSASEFKQLLHLKPKEYSVQFLLF